MNEFRAIEKVAFDAKEVAFLTGLSLSYVRELLAKGVIKSFKIGKRRLIAREELTAFIARIAERAA